ncbi:MAG: DNA repair protein RecN [Oscillospiraceae bacterium]|nr:DNA repair protein RecN [Oscillospiraceae bacterium]
MLCNLQIENIAIIEKASVDFVDGFNVLTGETGAGKSIIIDSINAVLGEKTSRELIRTGCASANVSAYFSFVANQVNDLLATLDLPVEKDGSLLLNRKLYKDGRNICHVNGATVTVSVLHKIGMMLMNIHGQRDSQDLLNAEQHYQYVDRYGDLEDNFNAYTDAFTSWSTCKAEFKKALQAEADKDRRMDLLQYQIRELEVADIKVGERDQLNAQKKMIRNLDKLSKALNGAFASLDTAVSSADDAVHCIESAAKVSPSVSALNNSIHEAIAILSDCRDETASVLSQVDGADADLDQIEERLDLLFRLSKKYGNDEEQMLAFLQNCRDEYDNLLNAQAVIEKLQVKCDKAEQALQEVAKVLSDNRRLAAEKLRICIENELHFLDMPNAEFSVVFTPIEPSETGTDAIEFYITANPGEDAKPLTKVASGGELSRVMLAIKNALADKDVVGTLIFDEIDAGVSGRAAEKIGKKLKQAAINRQVLCITHLSQIACRADEHFLIEKTVRDDKTYTSITALDTDGRINELARMNGGITLTQVHRDAARQLLVDAGVLK